MGQVEALFHKPGLICFWALNDECSSQRIEQVIEALASANLSAVCLHARPGLLVPYGGTDWFELIREITDLCAQRGLQVWLYDEDPWSSGAAGGWVMAEQPEFAASAIEQFQAGPQPQPDGLFCFPTGKLLWCGWVRDEDGATEDLTDRVGILRQKWVHLDPWDSRYYYPATPRYSCPRAWTEDPQFALRVPQARHGWTLQAFVARPTALDTSHWGANPDTLNPAATRRFLERTHQRYWQQLGERFGREVRAIFVDEAKFHDPRPWTDGLFESFAAQFEYELRPRLWRLFSQRMDPTSMLTRLHYRQWCAERFDQAWMAPVAHWCREHGLSLVGHLSPEDDLVQQVSCLGNLMPLHRHFSLPGLDLIVPAVGDHDHPLLNVGVVGAVSAQQQQDKPGVLSESLGASGEHLTTDVAVRILRWQAMMGVTTPVVHAVFNSMQGLRRHEAPPDFGPDSPRWDLFTERAGELAEIQQVVRDSAQVAPVAVLWPIRSFAARPIESYSHESPLRDAFVDLLRECLDHQIGVHLIDEADLASCHCRDGAIHLGRARYSHLLIASCEVLLDRTWLLLQQWRQQGAEVVCVGPPPRWRQMPDAVVPAELSWCPVLSAKVSAAQLPRLVEIEPGGRDIRCTEWIRDNNRTRLVMNLRSAACQISVDGRAVVLEAGGLKIFPCGEVNT